MKAYIMYQTDAWLSYSSRDLRDDEFNLINISQTQGREFNYLIEEVECNQLL